MNSSISIIMGIYNCESTLSLAIESILNQTYTFWKLIICDDGSTDDSYKIAKSFSEKNENILLLRNQKNMGLNYTLNHCLKYVDTEYVARMDGDDISLPTRLEKEIQFLKKNPEYSIVSTNMIYFDEKGDWGKGKVNKVPTKKDFIKGTPFCHAPSMVKTEAYRKVNGYSEGNMILRIEDYHLWYKMYLIGYKGYNIEEALYKMRDDRKALKRRKYKFRINEAYLKFLILRDFHLPYYYCIYILKPLMIGIVPSFFYEILHKKKMSIIENV